jgi:hypothetical protein
VTEQVLQKHAKNRPLSLVFVPAAEAAAAALSRQLESEQHSPRETEELLVRASTAAAQRSAQQPARGGFRRALSPAALWFGALCARQWTTSLVDDAAGAGGATANHRSCAQH